MTEEIAVDDKSKRHKVADDIRQGFSDIMKQMQGLCIDQDDLITGMILATVSQEHLVMLGPPGSNKTRVCDLYVALCGANERVALERRAADEDEDEEITQVMIDTASYTFTVTLDRHATPEALLGPYSIKGLQNDQHIRATRNTIVEATYAVLEEVFSCNGATLRALVRILNEREFDNGGKRISIPLLSVFASTNDEPLEHLAAVYDRFLFRYQVGYIKSNRRTAFTQMLSTNGTKAQDLDSVLSVKQLKLSSMFASQVKIPDGIYGTLYELRSQMLVENLQPSDRRWHKAVDVIKAVAWLRGADEAEPQDVFSLRNILWNRVDEQAKVFELLAPYQTMTSVQEENDLMADVEKIFKSAMSSAEVDDMLGEVRINASVEISMIARKITKQDARDRISKMVVELEQGVIVGGSSNESSAF